MINSKLTKFSRGKIELFDFNQINNSLKINIVDEDKGSNIFIGTDNGFVIILKTGEIKKYFQDLPEKKFEVYSFYFDSFNSVWISTNYGLRFWNWKDLKLLYEWKTIITNQNNLSSINSLNGQIYISSENGLFIFPKNEDEIKEIQPRSFILEILIDGKKYDVLSEIRVKSIKSLTIRFDGVFLSSNNNLEFSYKLKGFDDDWSLPTTVREVKYANLPDGEYRFLVRSRFYYTNWTEPVSTNLIHITKPFYYQYEFIIFFLLILTIVILIALVLKSRNERIPSNKEIKNLNQQIKSLEKQNKQMRVEINKALELSRSRMKFLASLSHELRTPINSLIGFIDLLMDPKLNLN